jgi:uncharacterized protein (TIGR04222 family)
MNPITWPGERFIVAYVILALVLVATGYVLWLVGGRGSRTARVTDLTDDPYRIAYLRGGVEETLRVALFNLVDRGILVFEDDKVRLKRGGAAEALRRPLDREIVNACRVELRVDKLLGKRAVRNAAAAYANDLGTVGLVSHGPEWALRRGFGFAAAGVLAGIAVTKIAYATSHGRTNVGFLVIAAIVATIWVSRTAAKRRTFSGGRMLSNLATLMRRMKDGSGRMKAGGATNEALLLAAVFGLYALPAGAFPMVEAMFPRPRPADSSSSSGGSDSGSSSCSSSCGGGGGCGGCGS